MLKTPMEKKDFYDSFNQGSRTEAQVSIKITRQAHLSMVEIDTAMFKSMLMA